jgi:predicted transcriptional regulator YdeE
MAVEIRRVYKEHLPAVRFVGKLYANKDRVNGSFGSHWGEWFQNGWFESLEKLPQIETPENGYIGLMGCGQENNDDFQYWIGMMLPENTKVPDGFIYIDIPEGDAGVCWIYGNENNGEIYGQKAHELCVQKLKENEMENIRDNFGKKIKWNWFFERYNCPRFTDKDDKGNVILDYGIYINKEPISKLK